MIYRSSKDPQVYFYEFQNKEEGADQANNNLPGSEDAAPFAVHNLHLDVASGDTNTADENADASTSLVDVKTEASPQVLPIEHEIVAGTPSAEASQIIENTQEPSPIVAATPETTLDSSDQNSYAIAAIKIESDSPATENQISDSHQSAPEDSQPIVEAQAEATPEAVINHNISNATPNASGAGPAGGFTPAQLVAAYGINQVSFAGTAANGAGQTIAIVDAYNDPTIASDLHAFDLQFGLADPHLTVVSQNGGQNALPSATWQLEESLDVEWAHAIAPGANIVFVTTNSAAYSDLFAGVKYAASLPNVSVISLSWGGPESRAETAYDNILTTPSGHAGITYFASSGDSGAPGGFPASSPNVVAVGGTTLTMSGTSYGSESAWSGSGGGQSAYEPEPAYQRSVQNTGYRTTPDVAFDANPSSGFSVYDSTSGWVKVGGTSAAAPSWAGIAAIINQGRALSGQAVYNSNSFLSALYKLPSADFHDITTGSNGIAAKAGYDEVTGLGSPIANRLIPDLVGSASTPTHPVAINHAPTNLVDIDPNANDVAKNAVIGTAVGITAHATDPDGDKLTYSLSDNAGGRFAINASTGTVTVGGVLDGLSHNITVKATDTGGLSTSQNFSIAPLISTVPTVLIGTNNNDSIVGNSRNDTIVGNNGNDTIFSGSGNNDISGNQGNDSIRGGGGNSQLSGNEGNDTIHADSGRSIVNGGVGNDVIYGDTGSSSLRGGDGNDTIFAGVGHDTIWGETGDDLLVSGVLNARFAFDNNSGKDTISGFESSNVISIGSHINGSNIVSFSDIVAQTRDVSGNAVINLGAGNSITLIGVHSASLTSAEFTFL